MSEDKYGKALGAWHLTVGGFDKDLYPKKGDNRKFRNILMNDNIRKNKALLFDKFEEFMVKLIERDHPPADETEKDMLEVYVEFNVNELFEEVMVSFGWTDKETLEKSKRETLKDIKKSIGEN